MESVSNTVLTIAAVFITVSNMYSISLRTPQAVLHMSERYINIPMDFGIWMSHSDQTPAKTI